jgi:hypothetical protein
LKHGNGIATASAVAAAASTLRWSGRNVISSCFADSARELKSGALKLGCTIAMPYPHTGTHLFYGYWMDHGNSHPFWCNISNLKT